MSGYDDLERPAPRQRHPTRARRQRPGRSGTGGRGKPDFSTLMIGAQLRSGDRDCRFRDHLSSATTTRRRRCRPRPAPSHTGTQSHRSRQQQARELSYINAAMTATVTRRSCAAVLRSRDLNPSRAGDQRGNTQRHRCSRSWACSRRPATPGRQTTPGVLPVTVICWRPGSRRRLRSLHPPCAHRKRCLLTTSFPAARIGSRPTSGVASWPAAIPSRSTPYAASSRTCPRHFEPRP